MTVQNRLSLNLDFYNKMCKIWDSFGVRDKSLSVACANQIKKVVWLVFIIARIKVLDSSRSRQELLEMVFLLYVVVRKLILLLPGEVTSDFFERLPSKDFNFVKSEVDAHLQRQLQMSPNIEEVKIIEKSVDSLFLKVRNLKLAQA